MQWGTSSASILDKTLLLRRSAWDPILTRSQSADVTTEFWESTAGWKSSYVHVRITPLLTSLAEDFAYGEYRGRFESQGIRPTLLWLLSTGRMRRGRALYRRCSGRAFGQGGTALSTGEEFNLSTSSFVIPFQKLTLHPCRHTRQDTTGTTVLSELESHGFLGETPSTVHALPLSAHFEVHIEQGPILCDKENGAPVGLVKGVQGFKWFEVELKGRSQHAATRELPLTSMTARALADQAWGYPSSDGTTT